MVDSGDGEGVVVVIANLRNEIFPIARFDPMTQLEYGFAVVEAPSKSDESTKTGPI